MINLHLHGLRIHSSLGLVGIHGTDRSLDITLRAEHAPDLVVLLGADMLGLDFDALEFRLTVCGVTLRKPSQMAEVLAAILRAARFASEGSLDEVLQDEKTWATQVQDTLLKLQERHLRTRLARLMGVQQEALDGFAPSFPVRTRSGLTNVLEGPLLGVGTRFTLEYEHLLMYAGTVPARKITRLSDLTSAVELAASVDQKLERERAQASA